MTLKKSLFVFIVLSLFVYILTPYYSTWQMMKAVQSGSAEQMRKYIDFQMVQASIKQQMQTALDQQIQEDPMMGVMAKMFQPVFDKMVEEVLYPEKLAEVIKAGKLKPTQRTKKDKAKLGQENTITPIQEPLSWYAFLDRPTRFRIAVGNIVLYMKLQDWQWKMTAVGFDDLLNMNNSGVATKKEIIADEIDTYSPVPPEAISNLSTIKKDISNTFFLGNSFNGYTQVEGVFFYLPVNSSSIKPEVTWIDALDIDNRSVLGKFSEKELEDRKKFLQGINSATGTWNDKIPMKSQSDKIVSARGICKIQVPTKIEKFSVDKSNLKQMQKNELTAVTLTGLSNGNVSLSYYIPFSHPKVEPVIIIRNKDGQPLRTRGAFSSVPDEPIESPKFNQAMRGVTTSITVVGTPVSADLFFALNLETVESEFIATKKPEVVFGELKSPIKRTRYERPIQESELKILTKEQVLNQLQVSFHEETNWDKSKKRYFKVTLPDIANSIFAKTIFDELQVFLQEQKLDVKAMRHHNKNEYRAYFNENTKDWSNKVINFDRIQGTLRIKYPANFEILKIAQGENKDNVHLDDVFLTYPDGNIPYYSNVFNTRSVIAYDKNNRQIALLDNSSMWQKGSKLIFWGKPEYVEVKKVVEWLDIEVPVSLGVAELQIDKSPYGMN